MTAVKPPYYDRRIRSVISPIFTYDFRGSPGVPENGRAEQSATDVEVTAELATHQSKVFRIARYPQLDASALSNSVAYEARLLTHDTPT